MIEYWPDTEIVKSNDNDFSVAYGKTDAEWFKMTAAAIAKAKADEHRRNNPPTPMIIMRAKPRSVRRMRQGGKPGNNGLGGIRILKPDSNAGKIRKCLSDAGYSLDAHEIAQRTGIEYIGIHGVMKIDIKKGNILVIIEGGKRRRYKIGGFNE